MFTKKIKCAICDCKLLKEDSEEIRLDTADGLVELCICSDCGDLMDKISERMQKKSKKNDEPF